MNTIALPCFLAKLPFRIPFMLLVFISYNLNSFGQDYVSLPYLNGFESGSLGPEWVVNSSSSNGEVAVYPGGLFMWSNLTAEPHSGNYFLGMHHPDGGFYNTNTADLHLNLSNQNSVRLQFWWAEWNDETEEQDGIYLSDDGGNSFVKVLDLNGGSYTDLEYQYFNLSLDSIHAIHGLSYTSNYIIRFSQYDDYYFAGGNDGFLIDDVEVISEDYFYVDQSNSMGLENGENWTTAFANLQDALAVAESGDIICVAQGVYLPTDDGNRDSSFNIPDSVVLLGGFPMGGGLLSERNSTCYETVLSGDIGSVGDHSDNSYHVIVTRSVSKATIVDGFTITGGNADGDDSENTRGGGWLNSRLLGIMASPTIQNCVFIENSALTAGGALYNLGAGRGVSSPELINCVLSGNTAKEGGAIYSNSIFGGICAPKLINCILSGNVAEEGGALYNFGAISNGVSSPELINCVLSGNTAEVGGVIYHFGSAHPDESPAMINCIVTQNNAEVGPAFSMIYSKLSIQNSLFDLDLATLNSVGDGVTDNGGNKFDMDPLFAYAPAASAIPTTVGDFRLMSGSPAIDMGDNTANMEAEDLDGLSRVYNGIIDMGAYEWRPYCLPDTVYLDENGEGMVDESGLVGELPEFPGCVIDTIFEVPSVSCSDTSILYNLFLIKDGMDTVLRCTDTIWVLDTISPVIPIDEVELMLDTECMETMPDLSSYASDNCGVERFIQEPAVD
ncbi:choice-of-anchor Q domain-containing protein, partial [Membranihabitans maritimus]|uniref:choice-of-anchor Q domain-containing protein n=1 Tax=Membranihabitans maritimus TaxID=2904244 RepID=UPI001F1E5A93